MANNEKYNDETLVQRIANDDVDAFHLFYEKYCRQLINFAASYLPDLSDAEEIVQTVFVEFWENRKELDAARFTKSYLYKIAVNKVFNVLKRKVVETKYLRYIDLMEMETYNEAEKTIYQEELSAILQQLMDKLPEQQRKIFYMSRWEGLSHKEIAEQLQISPRTVENQVYRAFKFIRENIKTDHLVIFLLSDLMLISHF